MFGVGILLFSRMAIKDEGYAISQQNTQNFRCWRYESGEKVRGNQDIEGIKDGNMQGRYLALV